MTTPPEHDALLAAGYTVTQHTPHRIDYIRGPALLTWFAPMYRIGAPAPPTWSARVSGERQDWQTNMQPTAAAALDIVRARITAAADHLLTLAASATLEPR